MRLYIAEGLGTFALVLAGCGAVEAHERYGDPDHLGVALTFGLVVAAVIYALGRVSGAHINPAVTLALAVTRHLSWRRVPGYVAAQSLGAVAGAASLAAVFGAEGSLGVTVPVVGAWRAFALEIVLSMFLMLVVMAVATDGRSVPGVAGVAVGGTVALEALWAGPLTGASMNPARSLGPALVGGDVGTLWIYLLAPAIGAVVGAVVYQGLAGRAPVPGVEGVREKVDSLRWSWRRAAAARRRPGSEQSTMSFPQEQLAAVVPQGPRYSVGGSRSGRPLSLRR